METNFKIICPTDFSECSLNAIEYAAKLGEKYNADLILLHVPNLEDYRKLTNKEDQKIDQLSFIEKKLHSLLVAVKEESLSKGLRSCSAAIKEGKIVETIHAYSIDQKADLIIMGTEGVNDFKNNFIGTRSSKLMDYTSIDLMLIPRKVYFKIPRKIVYATNYIEEDKIAIQKVTKLASFFESEVDVLHVSTNAKSIEKFLHLTMVEEIKPFIKYHKVNYVFKAYRDGVGLGLENYLITAKGDILVTMSKKKSWFDQIFSQNISKKMSYFINKPLFVIKNG
ncbi:universal stress protein [Belliella kenyensis]|uniref:Universal stress protein n=1 Tax=Belliella kenyensis TaxID=1472724 RepID=A0ABV8EH38_9BACT|nr:universal stress protein [Belliella kenyensis]MCH7401927.1 universal stress protein [Belliella kenyensis]MDN3604427.1 universal stress protein [Belliella kenyensis]